MEKDVNDVVVGFLYFILIFCHAIAVVALMLGNAIGYTEFTYDLEFEPRIGIHLGLSTAFIVVYCLMTGVVSVFLSINRNLQRLVALQEVPKNSNVRTAVSAEGAAAIKKLQQWSPPKGRRTPE